MLETPIQTSTRGIAEYPSSEPSAPNLKQKQRMVREEAILNAARVMIAENGYEAMTMEDLAEKVGISKPTLYQHFPSKEILAVRSVVEFLERSIKRLREMDTNQAAIDRLKAYVRWMMTERFSPDHIVFCGVKVTLVPLIRTHPEYQVVRRQLLDRLAAIFDEAKTNGAIEPRFSTRTLIQMLFSLVRDTDYEQIVENGEATTREITETICAVYFGGICKTN